MPSRFSWLAWGLAALCAGIGGFLVARHVDSTPPALASGTWLPSARPIGEFTLHADTGRAFSVHDLLGHPTLVFFGFTHCPDVCPTTLNSVADALDKLGAKADRVQPLFITVDPKRDTPAVVKQYAAAFGPRIVGLTGTPEQIAAAAKAYRVYYAEHRTGTGPDDYSMDHSSVLYLMGPDGRFIAPVRADQTGPEIAAALAKLMS